MSRLFSFFDPDPAAFLDARCTEALKPGRHGDMPKWQAVLDALPVVETGWRIDNGVLVAGRPADDREALAETLKVLLPWRKGPLRLAHAGRRRGAGSGL